MLIPVIQSVIQIPVEIFHPKSNVPSRGSARMSKSIQITDVAFAVPVSDTASGAAPETRPKEDEEFFGDGD